MQVFSVKNKKKNVEKIEQKCDGYCIFVPRLHYPGKTGRISVDSNRTTQALNILRN